MAKSREPIRRAWAKALAPFGFELDGPVLKGAWSGLVRPSVVKVPLRLHKGKFLMRLCIVMDDPFLGEEVEGRLEVILSGDVGPEGVTLMHHGPSHFWSAPEKGDSVKALAEHGLPWMRRYCRLEELIDYYEEMLEKGMPDKGEKLTWMNRLAARWILRNLPRKTKPRRPPAFHRYLSLLHWRQGDRERACHHCQKWLEHAMTMWWRQEPDRTLRQFEAMGCGDLGYKGAEGLKRRVRGESGGKDPASS